MGEDSSKACVCLHIHKKARSELMTATADVETVSRFQVLQPPTASMVQSGGDEVLLSKHTVETTMLYYLYIDTTVMTVPEPVNPSISFVAIAKFPG